jgi:DNA-binding winged helix-turn-helix (wHTH) protein
VVARQRVDCDLTNEGAALNYRFAEFEIDIARQELRRAGAIVHVEPQVFDLLVHLIRNRDRIVSKDELFDAIWQGRIVSEATLSSRISAARRALGDSGNDQSVIRTLHKRGFRFVGDVDDDALRRLLLRQPRSRSKERSICRLQPTIRRNSCQLANRCRSTSLRVRFYRSRT